MGKQKSRSPSPHPRVEVRVEKMTEELSSLIGLPIGGLVPNRRRSPSVPRSPDMMGIFGNQKSVSLRKLAQVSMGLIILTYRWSYS